MAATFGRYLTEKENELNAYKLNADELDRFGQMLAELISEILKLNGITTHAISYRVKSEQSATAKLERKPGRYESIEDLTDILGLRVICYFADQVEDVAGVLQTEFEHKNGEDKKESLGDREFGYLSLHRITKLLPSRGDLIEYRRFKDVVFEIQIRSILQHAWAEIEHDLGYKGAGIPRHLRRRFSMLAGVLELADREFIALRNDVGEYEQSANAQAVSNPDVLELDQSTLEAVLANDALFENLDRRIAVAADATLVSDRTIVKDLSSRVSDLKEFGISNMSQLRTIASQRGDHVVLFVSKLLDDNLTGPRGLVPRGVFINFLASSLRVERTISQERFPTPPHGNRLRRVEDSWREVIKELGQPAALPTKPDA